MNISEIQRLNDAINFYTEKSEEYKNKVSIMTKGCIWFGCGHFIPDAEADYVCPLCGFKQRKNSAIIRQINGRRIGE